MPRQINSTSSSRSSRSNSSSSSSRSRSRSNSGSSSSSDNIRSCSNLKLPSLQSVTSHACSQLLAMAAFIIANPNVVFPQVRALNPVRHQMPVYVIPAPAVNYPTFKYVHPHSLVAREINWANWIPMWGPYLGAYMPYKPIINNWVSTNLLADDISRTFYEVDKDGNHLLEWNGIYTNHCQTGPRASSVWHKLDHCKSRKCAHL